MAEVFHRIYTNAPLIDDEVPRGQVQSFGTRDVSAVLPDVTGALDDLLRKTTPADVDIGYAVRRFMQGSIGYTCLITSYGNLVVVDGRTGILNHARLVPVQAGEVVFDVFALLEASKRFTNEVGRMPSEDRLAAYRQRIGGERQVELASVTLDELQFNIPREVLKDFLIACLFSLGTRGSQRFQIPDQQDAMTSLAWAWSALPTMLQRTSAFGFDVMEGCPVDAIFSSFNGARPRTLRPALNECVDRYLAHLLGGKSNWLSILRNPEITSVTELDQLIQREAPAALPSAQTERVDEVKNQNKAQTRRGDEPAGSGQVNAAELERQYKAMEASLKQYVDQRLADFKKQQPPAGQQQRSPETISNTTAQAETPSLMTKVAWSWRRHWIYWVLALTLAVVVAGVVIITRTGVPRPMTTVTPAQTDTNDETSSQTSITQSTPPPPSLSKEALQAAIKRAESSGQWAEELKNVITGGGVFAGAHIRDAAQADMPESSRDVIEGLASAVEKKNDIGIGGRKTLRTYLLESIAAKVAQDDGVPVKVVVDGKPNELSAELLEHVRTNYRVTNAANANGQEFQAEVILRWMERREP